MKQGASSMKPIDLTKKDPEINTGFYNFNTYFNI